MSRLAKAVGAMQLRLSYLAAPKEKRDSASRRYLHDLNLEDVVVLQDLGGVSVQQAEEFVLDLAVGQVERGQDAEGDVLVLHGAPFGLLTVCQSEGREPLTLTSRLDGCFGRGRLLLREVRLGGLGGFGRDEPGCVLDLGGARVVLAQVSAKRLGIDANLLGEGLGRDDGVGHDDPFVVSGAGCDRRKHILSTWRARVKGFVRVYIVMSACLRTHMLDHAHHVPHRSCTTSMLDAVNACLHQASSPLPPPLRARALKAWLDYERSEPAVRFFGNLKPRMELIHA